MNPAGIIFIVFYVIFLLIVFGISAVFYALHAIAFQKIAKRRGIEKAWFAWVPVAQNYLMGAVADDIESYNGKETKYRRGLLWSTLAPFFAGLLMIVIVILIAVSASGDGGIMLVLMPMIFIFYAMIFAGVIVMMVLYYITLYKIFKDYVPESATLYTVLSIFVNVCTPFLLFSLKDKESASMARGYKG